MASAESIIKEQSLSQKVMIVVITGLRSHFRRAWKQADGYREAELC